MARTKVRQDDQIAPSRVYDDTIDPSEAAFETSPEGLQDDLNSLRSALLYLRNRQSSGSWWDTLAVPSAFPGEGATARGVDELNAALYALERRRFIRPVENLTTVSVPAGQNYVVLGTGELPSDPTAAIGASTLGTVIAVHAGAFGTHSLDEAAGRTAISPKNLVVVVAAGSRDPILSGGRRVYGLLQSEDGTDGHTLTDSTPTRAQISFVRTNSAGNDLEAVPAVDIASTAINYIARERVGLTDLTDQDFVSGVWVDVAAGSGGGGINEAQHESLDTLVHKLAETSYTTYGYTGSNLTSVTTWTDSGMTTKIREVTFTYFGDSSLASAVTEQYDGLGSVVTTLTKTFGYSGGSLDTIDVTRT